MAKDDLPGDPRTRLIDIAARLTDNESMGGDTADWLRNFRKNYRHMVATFGLAIGAVDLDQAERQTDASLTKAKGVG